MANLVIVIYLKIFVVKLQQPNFLGISFTETFCLHLFNQIRVFQEAYMGICVFVCMYGCACIQIY